MTDSRFRLTLALMLTLPLVLVLSMLVFVVPSTDNCLPVGFTADVAAEPVAVSSLAPLTARVASWNVLHTNATNRMSAGARTIGDSADVIGFQELKRIRVAGVTRSLADDGWRITPGYTSVQIAWRASRYTALAQGSIKVLDATRIEDGTAGTSIGPKWLQWVQLRDRTTGAVFFVVNHHLIPDIDHDGHPRDAPRRIEVYRQQMAAMLTVVAKLRPYGPVAVTGDFNVGARADLRVADPIFPHAVMGKAGLASSWSKLGLPSQGTVHSRLIDYVWLTQDTGTFRQQRILGSYGSDHHAVAVTFDKITTTTGATQPASSTQALPTSLTVQVGGRPVTLDADQLKVAAAAIAEGKALNIPPRGWVVALAAAGAESGIRNLDHGDRDSVGPWQMRPSAGWGTIAKIRNLQLGARAFYGVAEHTDNPGLTDIAGWEQMTIAQAAQAVEVSAFPDAYSRWEDAAKAIVARLAGVVDAGAGTDPGCENTGTGLDGDCPATDQPSEDVLTPDGLLVLRCVAAQFPRIETIGTYPGHQPDQTRAVDIMIPGWPTSSGKALGTQIAEWVRAHQRELGVQYVIWDGRIWNIERDSEGWRTYFDAGSPDPNRAHRNHVHVSVYGNRGTGPAGSTGPAQAGAWHAPIGAAAQVGCGFGCYPGHTGQDYPAPVGTPVYAVNGGTVVRSESIVLERGKRRTCSALPLCGGTRISYGNLIVIKLAGGGETTAWYAHLSARRVSVGQTVRPGQIVGAVGYEGHVLPKGPAGAHLHLEIRQDGTPVNPLPYLHDKGL